MSKPQSNWRPQRKDLRSTHSGHKKYMKPFAYLDSPLKNESFGDVESPTKKVTQRDNPGSRNHDYHWSSWSAVEDGGLETNCNIDLQEINALKAENRQLKEQVAFLSKYNLDLQLRHLFQTLKKIKESRFALSKFPALDILNLLIDHKDQILVNCEALEKQIRDAKQRFDAAQKNFTLVPDERVMEKREGQIKAAAEQLANAYSLLYEICDESKVSSLLADVNTLLESMTSNPEEVNFVHMTHRRQMTPGRFKECISQLQNLAQLENSTSPESKELEYKMHKVIEGFQVTTSVLFNPSFLERLPSPPYLLHLTTEAVMAAEAEEKRLSFAGSDPMEGFSLGSIHALLTEIHQEASRLLELNLSNKMAAIELEDQMEVRIFRRDNKDKDSLRAGKF